MVPFSLCTTVPTLEFAGVHEFEWQQLALLGLPLLQLCNTSGYFLSNSNIGEDRHIDMTTKLKAGDEGNEEIATCVAKLEEWKPVTATVKLMPSLQQMPLELYNCRCTVGS